MNFPTTTPNHAQPMTFTDLESSYEFITNNLKSFRQCALRDSWDDSEREKKLVVGRLMQSRLAGLILGSA